MVHDYETILGMGLDGYRAHIAAQRGVHAPGQAEFYDVMDIMLDAVIVYIERSAKAAAGELRAVFVYIAHKQPETFHQALQLVWILHMLNGADSFGRFDNYLLPFFEKDSPDHAFSLLVECFLKIEQVNSIQNMCIGGVNRDGTDNLTALTWLIIIERTGYSA